MTGVRRRDEDGFTLLELVTVVLIISILVAIAIASYSFSTTRSREVTCLQNQRILASAVEIYKGGHDGGLPPVTDPADDAATQLEIRDTLRTYAKWPAPDFAACTEGGGVYLSVNHLTGDVACANHPK
jgi:prepilin-type N-terminal cleavage/methylation domain-containing protein